MSMAEWFLLTWAVLATLLAGLFHNSAKRAIVHHRMLSLLLADVCCGDVVPKKINENTYSVENDDMRITMQRRGEKD